MNILKLLKMTFTFIEIVLGSQVGLELNVQVNTIKFKSRQSVYFTTPFVGRFSPLSA